MALPQSVPTRYVISASERSKVPSGISADDEAELD